MNETEERELTVLSIVDDYLRTHGYDGLYNEEECACLIHDLEPCSRMTGNCQPGYKLPCDCGDHDWHVGPKAEVP